MQKQQLVLVFFLILNCQEAYLVVQKPVSEKHIITSCLQGERKAQYMLYNNYKHMLYGVCLRYARSKQEAEDILQDGFFKIFKDLHQYKGNNQLGGWMKRVMVNTALMHIRKHRTKEMATQSFDVQQHDMGSWEEAQKYEKNGDVIIQLIQKMPAVYQVVFNLRAIEEYSFKEIAEQMQMNGSTVRSHYHRARTLLQKLYAEFIIDE